MNEKASAKAAREPQRQARSKGRPVEWWIFVLVMSAVAGIVVLSVLRAYVLPAMITRAKEINPQTACAANLSGIGRACLAYARDAEGALPMSLEVLTQDQQASLTWDPLACPACGSAYIYVPGHTIRDNHTEVIAYEPLSYHKAKGAHMLHLDGSVRWTTPKDYAQEMVRVQTHLHSIATRPSESTSPTTAPAT